MTNVTNYCDYQDAAAALLDIEALGQEGSIDA